MADLGDDADVGELQRSEGCHGRLEEQVRPFASTLVLEVEAGDRNGARQDLDDARDGCARPGMPDPPGKDPPSRDLRAPGAGRVKVYVDGAYKATVDLDGPAASRLVVWRGAWSSLSAHTVQLRPVGDGWVYLDAWVSIR